MPAEEQHVWPWQTKRDIDRHRPLCPQLSPSGRPLPCCGLGAWNLLGPNPTPNLTPNRDTPPKPKPALIPNPSFEPPSGMGPHFSPRGRSQDRSRFGPVDVTGPNPKPSLGSLPMGTQFQRLTASHAWGPEAVRLTRHGTWKLTMSFPRPGCSCPGGFLRLLHQGSIDLCGLGSQ